jgi:hypothetical protein
MNMSQLADAEQTRNRTEILNQFFRGMLLLNGGGCLALLALLQAIWGDISPSFVRIVVFSMALFLAGLVFSAVSQFTRYTTSVDLQFGHAESGRLGQRVYIGLVVASVVAFVLGAIVILWGLSSFAELAGPGRLSHAAW